MINMTSIEPDSVSEQKLYPDRLMLPLTCIGAGGIGSSAIPLFVRAGVRQITIWDNDTVEPVNLQMQNFYANDISHYKAIVMAARALQINPELQVTAHTMRFTQDDPLDGIVLSAVDSMESRSAIFDAVQKQKERVELLVDGRFTRKGDFIDVYCIDPRSKEELELYKGWLFSDSEVLKTPRADSMTAHVPYILSGLIGEALAGWATNRSHPWKVTYDAVSHHTERYYAAAFK
jgi:hypothetical protein